MKEARPVAEALAAETGQAVAVAVWGNFGPTVIRMIDARQPLHVAMRIGTVTSMFGTATGRAFAAVLPPERIADALVDSALGANGQAAPNTVPDADQSAARREFTLHGCTRAVGHPMRGRRPWPLLFGVQRPRCRPGWAPHGAAERSRRSVSPHVIGQC